MASSATTVSAFAVAVVAVAMASPIVFQGQIQDPLAIEFADKAICFVIAGDGGNFTCTAPDDTIYLNGTDGITITTNGDPHVANATADTVIIGFNGTLAGTITNCQNIGGGEEVCVGKLFDDLQFKTFYGINGINITSDANSITIDGSAIGGETNTGLSLGGDADVFKNKIGPTLNFRGITAGDGITIIERPNDILINATSVVNSINDISDVTITSVSNGDILQFNSTTGQWENVDSSLFTSDVDVQVKEGGTNVGSPRNINFVDTNDFVILEDVGNNEIDLAINRDGAFGFPSLDSTGLLSWNSLNFTLSDIHDLNNVEVGPCTNDQVLKFNSTTSEFECQTLSSGITTLGGLSDVTIASVSNSNILHYNSTTGDWENITGSDWLDDSFNCSPNQILQFTTVWGCIATPNDTDQEVQVKEAGTNVGVPRPINFVDSNDFVILEDVGNNEIDIAINRDGAFGIPSLDSTGLMTWDRLNFTLADIHDMANVQTGACANNEILKWNNTSGQFECQVDLVGAGSLNDLTDVIISAVTNSNILHYNGTSGTWENITIDEWLNDNFPTATNSNVLHYNGTTNSWEAISLHEWFNDTFPTVIDGQIISYNSTTNEWNTIDPVQALGDLTDVTLDTPTNSNILHFNGTTNDWGNITLTEWLNDNFPTANDGDAVIYNATSGMWESLPAGGGGEPQISEFFTAFDGSGGCAETGDDFQNGVPPTDADFDWRICTFTTAFREISFQTATPNGWDPTGDLEITIYFYFQADTNNGDTCWQVNLEGLDADDLIFDINEASSGYTCQAPAGGGLADELNEMTFTFSAGSHNINEGELVLLHIMRDGDNAGDTNNKSAYLIGGQINWM